MSAQSRVAIVTDSDASIPPDLAARLGIQSVPINVHFGQESYRAGVDIDDRRLFERVDRDGSLPTTSAPSPGQFVDAYEAAFAAGANSAICLCVSSAISGTYASAVVARETMPERDITVVDTQSLSMGQGFMVLAAAEAVRAGASRDEAVAQALAVRARTHVYAVLSTLKYLAASGRVGHLAAGMAALLEVKPILTIRDAKLDLLERVRTRKAAWNRVIDLTRQSTGGRRVERMAIVHVNALQDAHQFELQIRAALPCPEQIVYAEFTPGLSVHSGPGLLGVAIVVESTG